MKILLVANVAKEHVNKFHIPTIKYLISKGWQVDIACSVDAEVPAGDNIYHMSWKRSPFTLKTFIGIEELKKLIAKNDYNIIYCHTPVGGLVARVAARSARKKGVKVVYCRPWSTLLQRCTSNELAGILSHGEMDGNDDRYVYHHQSGGL